ncbi:MAG: FxsA family protein [Chromatiales bacterium]|nr:FxsA family protein [Chromatiales bacterium]
MQLSGPLALALFVAVPVTELYLLIQVGGVIGALPTIGLVLLTAAVGVSLLRQQGMATLARARERIDAGTLPAAELLEGVALLVAGALLLTPGFVTDTIGFLLLIPASRRALVRALIDRGVIHVAGRPGARPASGNTIEGEFERRDDL